MMCVIGSDYTDEGGSGNPPGTGFLSISMLFTLQKKKNNTVTQSESWYANMSRLHFRINLI